MAQSGTQGKAAAAKAAGKAAKAAEESEPEDAGAMDEDDDPAATQGAVARTEKKFMAMTPDEQERKVAEVARFILFSAANGGCVTHLAIAKSLKELSPATVAITTRANLLLMNVCPGREGSTPQTGRLTRACPTAARSLA